MCLNRQDGEPTLTRVWWKTGLVSISQSMICLQGKHRGRDTKLHGALVDNPNSLACAAC